MHLNFRSLLVYIPLLLLILSCQSKKEESSNRSKRPQGPIKVEGFLVQPRAISNKIDVPGSLLPFEETQIRSEINGRIIRMNIEEGSLVTKGALLVKFFDEDLIAQSKKLQVQLKIKEKTAERNKELVSINGISQQEYDLSVLDVDNLKADMESIQIAISKTEIRAPYKGTLGLRNVSLGSFVSPTDIITTIRQLDKLKLEFSIPEKYAKDIVKGQRINFSVDRGQALHNATVLATETSVDQNTRTLKIRALVNETHPELVPGIFAKVILQLGKDNAALMIPSQAVIPQARNKQVIVLRRDSAKFITIETGIRDSAYVQVLNGLAEGDTIITSGLMSVRPNSSVKVTKVNRYQ